MPRTDKLRIRNPFRDPLVTELIEDPPHYRKIFSEQILVGETLQVFQPANVVLVGPQGSGKSMILNLVRHAVISEWLAKGGNPPGPLRDVDPFFGISINLVRASFHAFGRRSVSKAMTPHSPDGHTLDTASAADFLNHYLFREFLQGLRSLLIPSDRGLRAWLRIRRAGIDEGSLVQGIASMDCWSGFYKECRSLESLLARCEFRLAAWRNFLNANIDAIPPEVWGTKTSVEGPLHSLGNLLKELGPSTTKLPLFVVIDQYEVLPELNPTFGTELQRLVNTLIKLRDPVVFYKIGARTYDWGGELRIWGAESRIEVQRDYLMINLASLLMRSEDSGWLFRQFARDVAYKRIRVEGHHSGISKTHVEKIFGPWSPEEEARLYFREKSGGISRRDVAIGKVSEAVRREIIRLCGLRPSPLELRLAGAWALQQKRRGSRDSDVVLRLRDRPWRREWWRKERTGVALLQIASRANQKRRYYGWSTLLYLSGGNVLAFLLLCGEIWDLATKVSVHPLRDRTLPPHVQADGVFAASEKWSVRDRNENIGGRRRYDVISRLGPAIHEALVRDLAISNPGHSGFSLRETDLVNTERGIEVAKFVQNAVSWGIFEERPHTSKEREAATRRKLYLHPLLSPFFAIPYIRVKEPYYASVDEVYDWFFGGRKVRFGRNGASAADGC